MPSYAIVKQKVDLARKEDAAPTLKAIAAAYAPDAAGTGVRIDTQDGIRLDFDARSAWVHVRASNTEPIMRLIAEAPTAAEATQLLGEVADAGCPLLTPNTGCRTRIPGTGFPLNEVIWVNSSTRPPIHLSVSSSKNPHSDCRFV